MSEVQANPPIEVIFEEVGYAVTPAGEIIPILEGSTVALCADGAGPNGPVFKYDTTGRLLRLLRPCEGIFKDGFE